MGPSTAENSHCYLRVKSCVHSRDLIPKIVGFPIFLFRFRESRERGKIGAILNLPFRHDMASIRYIFAYGSTYGVSALRRIYLADRSGHKTHFCKLLRHKKMQAKFRPHLSALQRISLNNVWHLL